MAGYVYVLHFTEPLHHARHYTGTTTSLTQRLEAHADGEGAKITSFLVSQDKTWKLGSVFVGSEAQAIAGEREIKRGNHAPLYCSICNKIAKSPKGMREIPVSLTGVK